MKKYRVTLYFHTSITVEVSADSERDALAEAYAEAGESKYDQQFLNNAEDDGTPYIREI